MNCSLVKFSEGTACDAEGTWKQMNWKEWKLNTVVCRFNLIQWLLSIFASEQWERWMEGIVLQSQNESSQVKMHFSIIIILIETELRTAILFINFIFVGNQVICQS